MTIAPTSNSDEAAETDMYSSRDACCLLLLMVRYVGSSGCVARDAGNGVSTRRGIYPNINLGSRESSMNTCDVAAGALDMSGLALCCAKSCCASMLRVLLPAP